VPVFRSTQKSAPVYISTGSGTSSSTHLRPRRIVSRCEKQSQRHAGGANCAGTRAGAACAADPAEHSPGRDSTERGAPLSDDLILTALRSQLFFPSSSPPPMRWLLWTSFSVVRSLATDRTSTFAPIAVFSS